MSQRSQLRPLVYYLAPNGIYSILLETVSSLTSRRLPPISLETFTASLACIEATYIRTPELALCHSSKLGIKSRSFHKFSKDMGYDLVDGDCPEFGRYSLRQAPGSIAYRAVV